MEVLVRIAEKKFMQNKICGNLAESTHKLFDEYCIPFFKKFDSQKWRVNIFWSQKCEAAHKFYKVINKNVMNR